MQPIVWYWNRLRRMSPPEIAHRARTGILSQVQYAGLLTVRHVPAPRDVRTVAVWPAQTGVIDPGPYLRAADQIAAGRLSVFALQLDMGPVPHWNRDWLTGTDAPLTFGKRLDYRDERLVGDIKYLWEPNRHLQLVTLAQAWRLSGDATYLRALGLQLSSWFDQCPYLRGPNWTSSLELSIRLINWSLVWCWIGGAESELFAAPGGVELRERWLRSVYQHCHFIAGHLSAYSSANNHLIGELAGLYLAASVWPFWSATQRWREVAQRRLTREALRQNGADGVNREQAVAYQQFVLDFLLIAGLAARRTGADFTAEYWQRIEAMIQYLASIMDVAGHVPMIGDADDGYVVRLSQEAGFCPYRSLTATGAVLFGRSDFACKAGTVDDKTRWLLGPQAPAGFDVPPAALPATRRTFPDGGYYLLGAHFDTPSEIRLLMDVGPLGYLSLAAHGHADALSFTLSVGGREFLVDPGTYCYHTRREWREYFRGTSAHNTVGIDGESQSVSGGNFMWVRQARARCLSWRSDDEFDECVGEHDGYRRLADPVTHRRSVQLMKNENRIRVHDRLDCKQAHLCERYWHFAEDCEVHVEEGRITASNAGIRIRLTPDEPELECVVLHGSEAPPGGWISRRFDVKVPATTVIWRTPIQGNTPLRTEIECFV